MSSTLNGNYLPSYNDCQRICATNSNFYEKIITLNGFTVSIFNYRLAEFNDFANPIPDDKTIDAFELRGLTFIHQNDGRHLRFLMLSKFFNLNQVESTQLTALRDVNVIKVQTKQDGSMIRFIRMPDGSVHAKTKAGFDNDQAKMAQALYNKNPQLANFINETLDQRLSAIFELVSPHNQIVCRYDTTELILLQLRAEETGKYLDVDNHDLVLKFGIRATENISGLTSLADCADRVKTLPEGIEGWVVSLANGMLVKIKTEWYFERHGLLTNSLVRENLIIDLILNQKIDDALAQVQETDPRRAFCLSIRNAILDFYKSKEASIFALLQGHAGDRKSFAIKNKAHPDFRFAIQLFGKPKEDWIESLIPALNRDLLARTYRLEQAREFLSELGVKAATVNIENEE